MLFFLMVELKTLSLNLIIFINFDNIVSILDFDRMTMIRVKKKVFALIASNELVLKETKF